MYFRRAQRFADKLGSGLITGAADDDPSGLATYSQAGAQFGTGLLWTMAFTTPLMISIQMVSARIGWLTGQGLAASMRRVMPRWLTLCIVALLLCAVVPAGQIQAPWALVVVPLVPLVACAGCLAAMRAAGHASPLANLRNQARADLDMLRESSAP